MYQNSTGTHRRGTSSLPWFLPVHGTRDEEKVSGSPEPVHRRGESRTKEVDDFRPCNCGQDGVEGLNPSSKYLNFLTRIIPES